ncbi:MAG: hypothetical protein ACLQB4_06170 [Beijerinckiaceae bacterium]
MIEIGCLQLQSVVRAETESLSSPKMSGNVRCFAVHYAKKEGT